MLASVGGWLYGRPGGAEYEEILSVRQLDPPGCQRVAVGAILLYKAAQVL